MVDFGETLVNASLSPCRLVTVELQPSPCQGMRRVLQYGVVATLLGGIVRLPPVRARDAAKRAVAGWWDDVWLRRESDHQYCCSPKNATNSESCDFCSSLCRSEGESRGYSSYSGPLFRAEETPIAYDRGYQDDHFRLLAKIIRNRNSSLESPPPHPTPATGLFARVLAVCWWPIQSRVRRRVV